MIDELNADADWRAVFGRVNKRQRDQELVLRFFAMRHDGSRYSRPLKGFLNRFMKSNRQLERFSAEQLREDFRRTVKTIRAALGDRPFRPEGVLNAAILDSVMVAVSEGIATGVVTEKNLRERYEALLANDAYRASTKGNTAQEEQVERRLKLAREAFGVPEATSRVSQQ